MSDLEYTKTADDIASQGAWTLASGTAATGYPLSNLFSGEPFNPFKANETAITVVSDFGAPVTPALVVIVNHNFTPGLTGVMLEGSNDSFATTAFSKEFPAASYWENGFPVNLHLDLRAFNPSHRYWRVRMTVASSVTVSIGELVFVTAILSLVGSLMVNGSNSPAEDEDHPINEHRTDAGISTIQVHGTWIRQITGDVMQDDTNAAAIRSWNRSSFGRGSPFILLTHVSPDTAEYVRFGASKLTRTYVGVGLRSVYTLTFEVMSVGLKPTPSAV